MSNSLDLNGERFEAGAEIDLALGLIGIGVGDDAADYCKARGGVLDSFPTDLSDELGGDVVGKKIGP